MCTSLYHEAPFASVPPLTSKEAISSCASAQGRCITLKHFNKIPMPVSIISHIEDMVIREHQTSTMCFTGRYGHPLEDPSEVDENENDSDEDDDAPTPDIIA
jgi:hypothetical protein